MALSDPGRDRGARACAAAVRYHSFELGRSTLYVAKRTADGDSMRLLFRDRLVPLVALVGAGAVFPGASLHFLGHDSPGHLGMKVHFIGVGLSAVAATLAAFALTLVGVRRKDARVVLVGTAFTAMAALLAIHGLATPDVIIGYNGVIALT